jgi:hypothetical protein
MTDQTADTSPEVIEDVSAPVVETEDTAAPESADTGDQAAAETTEPAKPKKSFQERMDEKTRLQREAERERDALREEVERLKASREEPEGDDAWIEEIVERRLSAREAERQKQAAQQAWLDRQAKVAEKHEDYFEAVIEGAERGAWPCTPDMAEAIRESELGADVAYHLAKNPDEARRIAGLSPYSQVRELGRIEATISAASSTTPKAKSTTSAPQPAPQARGAGGQFKVAADTSDFAAFEAQYKLS